MTKQGWQFWVDRGGTFTDVIAKTPDGKLIVQKLLSENRGHYQDAAVTGIDNILSRYGESGCIDSIKMGTTVATNALLERQGEPTVLAITRGFGDALQIGYQNRPDIFALHILAPGLLYDAVIEVNERIDADGNKLQALDTEAVKTELTKAYENGFRSIAVCLMHAYRFEDHELAVGALAREIGFRQISLSHEVSPLMKLVSRGDTTVVDAYLSPVLFQYIKGLKQGLISAELTAERIMFMQSNGGLTDERFFRGKDSILSGPAGGVVGMVATGESLTDGRLIGFDMGGTSTDVSLFADDFEVVNYTEIAGIRLRSPMIRINTIAAGGGSLLKFESGRLQVGPESAGADPGPTSYRQGGPLTVTDANVMLGKVIPEFFPSVFGLNANEELDKKSVIQAFLDLAYQINQATGKTMLPEEVAEGFIRIAVDNMANAIKQVSVQRGYDPGEFTLCCFGGAAGQHACLVADQLGIESILIHPLAGVLSAYGIGVAPLRSYQQRAVEEELDQVALEKLEPVIQKLCRQCIDALKDQGVPQDSITVKTILNIKVAGSDTYLPLRWAKLATMLEAFQSAHKSRFGMVYEDQKLSIDSLRVEAEGSINDIETHPRITNHRSDSASPNQPVRIFCNGTWVDAAVYRRANLVSGQSLAGPAVVVEETTTTVVEPGWQLQHHDSGHLILSRNEAATKSEDVSTRPDPVMLEVFNNHFMHVAEQMGVVLKNTAHSVNIKERLDFSCALFDNTGNLIANAPHIPVHLGSMGDSVAAVLSDNKDKIEPGDVFMLNAPYNGGSHLPDITVITPVFDSAGQKILFLVACRAHHADIGGVTPGSMPPFSRRIEEEGVVFDNFRLVNEHRFCEAELKQRLASGQTPARNPAQNIADLRAQIAANERGVEELNAMVKHFGLETVQAYMGHVRNNADESVRSVIERLTDGKFCYELDSGDQIRVEITIDPKKREVLIDFSGTSPQSSGNFNAPVSVTRAAVLYVFRSLIAKNIPLNAGCLNALRLHIPEGCLLNPSYSAAVVAGNVETSQCVVNALYGALNVMASAQGTMNNLTFGNDRYQYYETLCGGSGAGEYFDGTDAVHTHMTNTRMTDPEVLEARFPVRVRECSIHANSGGAGRHHGGNGIVRKLEFLESMQVAIISNNRRIAPFGICGGEPGQPGLNYLIRQNGKKEILGAVDQAAVKTGDTIVIETPGGGGYGKPH